MMKVIVPIALEIRIGYVPSLCAIKRCRVDNTLSFVVVVPSPLPLLPSLLPSLLLLILGRSLPSTNAELMPWHSANNKTLVEVASLGGAVVVVLAVGAVFKVVGAAIFRFFRDEDLLPDLPPPEASNSRIALVVLGSTLGLPAQAPNRWFISCSIRCNKTSSPCSLSKAVHDALSG